MKFRLAFLTLILGLNMILAGCSQMKDANLPLLTKTALPTLERENPPTPTDMKTVSPKPTKSGFEEQIPLPISSISNETKECASKKVERYLPEPNVPENYIGKTFDSLHLPDGLERVSGRLIDMNPNSIYALVHVTIQSKNTNLLWLTEKICRKDYIHDVLTLPALKDNEELVFGCDVIGLGISGGLAIGEYEDGVIPLTKINYAWYPNLKTMKFEALSPVGLECLRDIGIHAP